MQPAEYETLAALESSYWWLVGKRRLVSEMIQQYAPSYQAANCIVDLGCGTGANLAYFHSLAHLVMGLDRSLNALTFAKQTYHGPLNQADILHLPLADHSVTVITLLDVLYHQWIYDDKIALAESYRVLKPGGVLILTAPAFDFLTGPHDAANLTTRRYTVPQMVGKLQAVGFEIKKQSYVYALLFPVAFLWRWLQRAWIKHPHPTSDLHPLPFWLNSILLTLFSLELAWLKVSRLPWGTSILVVAHKPLPG